MMFAQTLAVAVIVVSCCLYSIWTLLLPGTVRLRLARAVLRWPLPATLKGRLRQWTQKPVNDGCSSCAKAAPPQPTAAAQPIRIVRRRNGSGR